MTYLPSPQSADDDDNKAAKPGANTPVRRGRKATAKPARTSGRFAAPAPIAPSETEAPLHESEQAQGKRRDDDDIVAYMETVEVEDGLTLSDGTVVSSHPTERSMPAIFTFAPFPLPIGPLLLAALLALIAFTLTGCNETHAQTPPAPPVVTVAPAEAKPVTEWDEFTGRTEAVEAVEVKPRISGYITEVRFKAGQLVKKGDALFIIDPRPYQVVVDQRQAEVDRAKVRVANAERMARRASKLLDGKVISTEAEDTISSAYEEAKTALSSAVAQLDAAKLDLEFTTVRSPIDGRVSRALLTTGNYVSTTAKAGEPSLLTSIVSVDPIYVHVDIDEGTLLKLKTLEASTQTATAEGRKVRLADGTEAEEKIPVEMALTGQDGFPYKGYVESFDNRLDANTSTLLLRVVIPNTDGRLVPGLFTRVRVPTSDSRETVLVAETAVGTDQAQKFVYTINSANIVEYRGVTLGPVVDGKRVIRTGLKPGERVVVNGIQRARPKMEVNPQAPATQTANNTATGSPSQDKN